MVLKLFGLKTQFFQILKTIQGQDQDLKNGLKIGLKTGLKDYIFVMVQSSPIQHIAEAAVLQRPTVR